MNNTSKTTCLALCVSCGICKIACPLGAIKLEFFQGQYLPVISEECNDCGICLQVCPGYEVNLEILYRYESRDLPEDIYLGHVLESYICYTKNKRIREKSTSGGMVTSLIVELMQNGYYRGAFVLPFKEPSNALAKLQFTENMEEIIAASKSKYLPVSVETVVSMIEKLKSSIIVSTPCQIHGIKKYCKLNKIDYSKHLFLGLFCERTLNYNLLAYYKWKYGKGGNIISFDYRNKGKNGWPGHTKLTFDDGNKLFVDRSVRMNLKKFFQLKRCLFCIDKLNQLADISFGDCYIKGEESELGQSNIILRTEKGKRALELVKDSFVLKRVDASLISDSQKIEDKADNLNFCELLTAKAGHTIYPGVQTRTVFGSNRQKLENKFRNKVDSIESGCDCLIFSQIDKKLKQELLRKNFRKYTGLIARRIGILK